MSTFPRPATEPVFALVHPRRLEALDEVASCARAMLEQGDADDFEALIAALTALSDMDDL